MLSDIFNSINFFDLMNTLKGGNYFEFLFPFLLFFAVIFTVLQKIKIFKNKNGKPKKPVIFIIALIISWYSITFDLGTGYKVSDVLIMMFPNISTLTILVLTLYIVGSLFGKNFFRGLFRKDHGAFFHMAIGVIALAAVIFYLGIGFGFWNYDYLDPASYWNFVLAIAFLIMGIVFMVVGMPGLGLIMLIVLGIFIYNYGEGNILEYFMDPVIFIVLLIILLFNWVLKDDTDKEKELRESIEEWEKDMGKKNLEPYKDIIYDIGDVSYKKNKEKLKELLKKRNS